MLSLEESGRADTVGETVTSADYAPFIYCFALPQISDTPPCAIASRRAGEGRPSDLYVGDELVASVEVGCRSCGGWSPRRSQQSS